MLAFVIPFLALLSFVSGRTPADRQAAVGQEETPTQSGVAVGGQEFSQVTAPIAIYKPDPKYTPEALSRRIEGTVIVEALIDASGTPQHVKVARSLGYGLDQSAIDCVQSWRFEPARKNGVPSEFSITVEVAFHLPRAPAPRPQLRHYVASDGSFILDYPSSLQVRRESDGTISQGCIACFSYDRNLFPKSNFASAEFWVGLATNPAGSDSDTPQPIDRKEDCVRFYGLDNVQRLPQRLIAGTFFARIRWGGAAAGTESDTELLRTFHNGKCYELGISVAVVGAYDPQDYASGRINRFTEADRQLVWKELQQAVQSFRFQH
ncbi:MAG: energy transducer TonB [Acidobacteria bacterium]|nr:energy transducer TonB [Acidobacteriota bacterium]MBV9145220.1 energy transducer TonB [Acidobacteriota bacterium]MBV9436365.1 energy transducer TonB [Acidobacteriota bacterium]